MMLVQTFLPFLTLLLLHDASKAKPIVDEDGYVYNAFLSPWRFFALKRCKDSEYDDVFLVRFFKSDREWSVQFENIVKGYSFSRYCKKKSPLALYRTLRLLQDDAKHGFTLPF